MKTLKEIEKILATHEDELRIKYKPMVRSFFDHNMYALWVRKVQYIVAIKETMDVLTRIIIKR